MKSTWQSIKEHFKQIFVLSLLTALILGLSGLHTQDNRYPTFTIGTVYAAGNPDFTVNGTNDQVAFINALNAMPATGGKIVALATTYRFSGATVTRAINNVTIEGVGQGTFFQNNGSTPIFTAGGTGWTFRDFATDAGNVSASSYASTLTKDNVQEGTTHTGLYTDNVTATNSVFTTANVTTLNAPTGRGATYVIAASDATATEKAQADYVCDGIADNVQIQAAIDALPAIPTANGKVGSIHLSVGRFNIAATITLSGSGVMLFGEGDASANQRGATTLYMTNGANLSPMVNITGDNCRIIDVLIDGNKSNNSTAGSSVVVFTGSLNNIMNRVGILFSNGPGLEIFGDGGMYSDMFIESGSKQAYLIKGYGNKFVNCFSGSNTDASAGFGFNVYQSGAYRNSFVNCASKGDTIGFRVYQAFGNTFVGNQVRMSLKEGFKIGASYNNVFSDNIVSDASQTTTNTSSGFYVESITGVPSTYNIFSGNIVYSDTAKVQKYGFEEADTIQAHNTYSFNSSQNSGTSAALIQGITNIVQGNEGWIQKGEIRTYSGTIAGGSANAVTAVDNPFGQAVRVVKVDLEITTQSVASGTLSVGIGSSNTTEYATMFNALATDVGTSYPYFYTSTVTPGTQTVPINWASGSGNRYLNFFDKATNTNLAATFTVTVMGN
jgi:parallel beta-helix repeat protein